MTNEYIPFLKIAKRLASAELAGIKVTFMVFKLVDPIREATLSNLRACGKYTSIRSLPVMSRNTLSKLYVKCL